MNRLKKSRMENEEEEENVIVNMIDNHIYFYTDVDVESIRQLVTAIHVLNNTLKIQMVQFDTKPVIYLHINSNGGCVFSGLAGMDAITNSSIPVVTIIEGCAASAATLLSVVGKKRLMTRHSHTLLHQLSSEVWGTMSQITDEMRNLKHLMRMVKRIYHKHTLIKKPKLQRVLKQDIWFSSKKSLKLGIVDEIIGD